MKIEVGAQVIVISKGWRGYVASLGLHKTTLCVCVGPDNYLDIKVSDLRAVR